MLTPSVLLANAIFGGLIEIADANQDLGLTVRSSAIASVIMGGVGFLGGVLLGPPGLIAGGAVGGAVGLAITGTFKPFYKILREMSPEAKQRLVVVAKEKRHQHNHKFNRTVWLCNFQKTLGGHFFDL